jgi:drug/metabolite transporter (DMT)-like permease
VTFEQPGLLSISLPLLSALIYVAGALCLKRASELGVGTWRSAWTCNIVAAMVFSPLALFGGTVPAWQLLWQPALVGLLFVAGQVLSIRALQVGDVSVATPVLGLKIILVALATTLLLREPVSARLWMAALLSSGAIALLNATRSATHHHVGTTIVTSALAALAFAVFDVLVQKWSPAWGLGRFLPIMMGFVALYSLPFRSRTNRRANGITTAKTWLAWGAVCLAVQSVLFVSAIALFGRATSANVLYSSRGLWSVLAVWFVGHWFANREQHLPTGILAWRLCGAGLLLAAIVLAVLN